MRNVVAIEVPFFEGLNKPFLGPSLGEDDRQHYPRPLKGAERPKRA